MTEDKELFDCFRNANDNIYWICFFLLFCLLSGIIFGTMAIQGISSHTIDTCIKTFERQEIVSPSKKG